MIACSRKETSYGADSYQAGLPPIVLPTFFCRCAAAALDQIDCGRVQWSEQIPVRVEPRHPALFRSAATGSPR
jgi:hypothetical protein